MFQVEPYSPKQLSWWYSQREKIDMEPTYQRRGGLWSTDDQAYLIDSILNDYDIPKLYLVDFTYGVSDLNERTKAFAIVDGKQRFEAIFAFYRDQFPLHETFVFTEDPKLKLAGLNYSALKKAAPDVANKLDNFPISVMRIVTNEQERINELFVRLNRGKNLSGAEIRNAMGGPAPKLIKSIADHTFFRDYVKFSLKRGEHQNAAAKLLLFEYSGEARGTKKSQLDAFVKSVKAQPSDKLQVAYRRVIDTLDEMVDVFLPRDPLLGSGGIIPVYYWVVRSNEQNWLTRPFLESFEEERRSAAEEMGDEEPVNESELDLFNYTQFNRSTNDASSHLGRIAILQERLLAVLKVYARQTKERKRKRG